MGSVISQIDMKINQDWTPLVDKYNKMRDMFLAKPDLPGLYIEGYGGKRYDFGANGSFVFYNAFTPNPYTGGCMAGPVVTKMLPWIDKFLQDTAHFDVVGIGIQYLAGDMNKHIDDEYNPSRISQCKLNYMFHACDAVTYGIAADDTIEQHPTEKDTAWLLNIDRPHWVENKSDRYILTIPFRNPYDEVLEWFNSQPPLIYG